MVRNHNSLRFAIILILLALTCTLLVRPMAATTPTAHADDAPAAPDASSPFGVAGVMRWPVWGTFDQPADLMLKTGGAWVREDFAWSLIEPAPDQFDWTATDRIVGQLGARNLNILGLLAYSVSWATPTQEDDGTPMSFYAPDPDQYYTFVRTLVGRYKNVIHYWEVWNEPDNATFWKPAPDPAAYATILKTAYRAVKDEDPTAKVVTGGVSGNAVPFLEQALSGDAANSFDILAIHPYAVPLDMNQARTESRPEVHKMLDVELNKYQAFLSRHNLDKPIWVTEVGWPANNWGLDESLQADYLAQTYALLLSSGLTERIFAYSFKDGSADPADSWGLVTWGSGATDLSQTRPSFAAYNTSARLLTGTSPGGRLQLAQTSTILDFEATAPWSNSTQGSGTLSSSGEQHVDGTSSGKLEYTLPEANQAIDFAPAAPVDLPGSPTRLGIWALGDGSGDYLSAWLKDRDGELFKVRLGAILGRNAGWRYYEAAIDSYYFGWEMAGGNSANGKPDYPLQFVGFRLENTPDEPAGSGTIYLDDLQTWEGPDVTSVRFNRPDGSVVDVLWSAQPTQATLATTSPQAQVFMRDGAESSVDAQNGTLTLDVSDSPIYVVHSPAEGTAKAEAKAPPSDVASSLCQATAQASNLSGLGNLYFGQTGYNVSEPFLSFWQSHGGLNRLGYPITEAFSGRLDDGKNYTQQYFERARIEYHPENSAPEDVQLGLLGTWAAQHADLSHPYHADSAGTYFPETGNTLDLFNSWWSNNGSLTTFGFPITPEVQEVNSADGKTYTVQYFERARMESHPEYAGSPEEVLLGLLGTEYVVSQNCGQ